MKRQKIRAKSALQTGHFLEQVWSEFGAAQTCENERILQVLGLKKASLEHGAYIYIVQSPISVEQVRNWMLIVQDAADTITNQTRARRLRGCVWQLNQLMGRAAIDAEFWERCGEVLTQVSGWLIVGRQYPAGVVKGYRYLLDRCYADIQALPPEAQAAARLGVEIGELLYLELTSDTNQEDLCHH